MQPKLEFGLHDSKIAIIDMRKHYRSKNFTQEKSAIRIVDEIIMNFAWDKKVVLNYSKTRIENPIDAGTTFKRIMDLIFNIYGFDYVKKNLSIQANPELTFLFNYVVAATSQQFQSHSNEEFYNNVCTLCAHDIILQ